MTASTALFTINKKQSGTLDSRRSNNTYNKYNPPLAQGNRSYLQNALKKNNLSSYCDDKSTKSNVDFSAR